MPPDAVKVLLIDDDEDDFATTGLLLRRIPGPTRFALDWVSRYGEGLDTLLQGRHDVCLLDYRLGARTGLDLLREAQEAGCRTPVILLTGQDAPEVDFGALRAGAMDYLVKGQADATLLDRSIRYAIERSKVDRLKDSLLAFASHELRTPVATIRGYAELILDAADEPIGPHGREMIGSIIHAADHLISIISGFLDLSRLDAGKPLEVLVEDFDLRELISEAAEVSRMSARRCEFEVQCAPSLTRLRADRPKLLLVLTNLLTNADKYSPDGCVVHLTVAEDEGAVRFSVADRGLGIPPEALEHVFTPFYRAQSSQHPGIRGTGIGLYLCKHIVEAHGGSVWLDSEPGVGTTVHFTIPK